MPTILQRYLSSMSLLNGAYELSPPRGYQHDENDYDRQYGAEQVEPEVRREEAAQLMTICRRHGLPVGATAVEIGCGTGRISIGMAMQPDVGHLFVTDPSPAFCRIVQKKLEGITVEAAEVTFGVLRAEDIGVLPPGAASLIVLRSVLHHITDVEGFLRACAGVLPAGGLLICEEPYYEGYMMMGFLGQFIETALLAGGHACSGKEREHIDFFVATMQFYCRRDVDKSEAEDKHLFRPDELMASGRAMKLELTHYPNWRLTMSDESNEHARIGYFQRFFADYIRYCMDWPPEFAVKVAQATTQYFRFFEPMERAGNTTPYCFGTFVFVKQ